MNYSKWCESVPGSLWSPGRYGFPSDSTSFLFHHSEVYGRSKKESCQNKTNSILPPRQSQKNKLSSFPWVSNQETFIDSIFSSAESQPNENCTNSVSSKQMYALDGNSLLAHSKSDFDVSNQNFLMPDKHVNSDNDCQVIEPTYVQGQGSSLLERNNRLSENNANLFKCKFCNINCSAIDELKSHVDVVHLQGKYPFFCIFCYKSMHNRRRYNDHMNMHNNVKAHTCPYCAKRFTFKSDVTRHLRNQVCKKQLLEFT